ncbi:hypothetical protein GGR09_000647 [Bartonella heixiaziensis]
MIGANFPVVFIRILSPVFCVIVKTIKCKTVKGESKRIVHYVCPLKMQCKGYVRRCVRWEVKSGAACGWEEGGEAWAGKE